MSDQSYSSDSQVNPDNMCFGVTNLDLTDSGILTIFGEESRRSDAEIWIPSHGEKPVIPHVKPEQIGTVKDALNVWLRLAPDERGCGHNSHRNKPLKICFFRIGEMENKKFILEMWNSQTICRVNVVHQNTNGEHEMICEWEY